MTPSPKKFLIPQATMPHPTLFAGSAVVAMAKAAGHTGIEPYPELAGTEGIQRIASDQKKARATRGALKRSTRAAVNALIDIQAEQQIVLGHIQPRWLRALVTVLMDADEVVTPELLAELRAAGPVVAADAVMKRLEYRL